MLTKIMKIKINFVLQRALIGNDKRVESFKQQAEDFMCRILPNSPSSSTSYTQGIYNNCAVCPYFYGEQFGNCYYK